MQRPITPEGHSRSWLFELSISRLDNRINVVSGKESYSLIRCREKTSEIRMLGLCSRIEKTSWLSVFSFLKQMKML